MMDLEEVKRIASNAMDLGLKYQPNELEIYIEEFSATSLNIQNGRLASTESNADFGLGCRIAFGKQVGIGFTNHISEKAIQVTIEDVAKTAKKVPADPEWQGLPRSSGQITENNFYFPKLLDTSIEDLAEITKDILSSCVVSGYKEPIIPVIGSTVLANGSSILLNSHGIEAFSRSTIFYTYMGVLAVSNGKPGPMHLDIFLSREKLIADAAQFASKIASEAVTLV